MGQKLRPLGNDDRRSLVSLNLLRLTSSLFVGSVSITFFSLIHVREFKRDVQDQRVLSFVSDTM